MPGDIAEPTVDEHAVEKLRLARSIVDKFGYALAIAAMWIPIKAAETTLTTLAGKQTILNVEVSFALGVTFTTSVLGGVKILRQRAELQRARQREERLEKRVRDLRERLAKRGDE